MAVPGPVIGFMTEFFKAHMFMVLQGGKTRFLLLRRVDLQMTMKRSKLSTVVRLSFNECL